MFSFVAGVERGSSEEITIRAGWLPATTLNGSTGKADAPADVLKLEEKTAEEIHLLKNAIATLKKENYAFYESNLKRLTAIREEISRAINKISTQRHLKRPTALGFVVGKENGNDDRKLYNDTGASKVAGAKQASPEPDIRFDPKRYFFFVKDYITGVTLGLEAIISNPEGRIDLNTSKDVDALRKQKFVLLKIQEDLISKIKEADEFIAPRKELIDQRINGSRKEKDLLREGPTSRGTPPAVTYSPASLPAAPLPRAAAQSTVGSSPASAPAVPLRLRPANGKQWTTNHADGLESARDRSQSNGAHK